MKTSCRIGVIPGAWRESGGGRGILAVGDAADEALEEELFSGGERGELGGDELLLLRDDLGQEGAAGIGEIEGVGAAVGDTAGESGGFEAVEELGDIGLGETEAIGEILLGEALGGAGDHEGAEEAVVQPVLAK